MKRNNSIKNTILVALFFSCLYSMSILMAGEIFKCKVNGKLVFTDQPCENGESVNLGKINTLKKVDSIKFSEATKNAYSSNRWYEDARGYNKALRTARSYKAPMIIYYRTDWCPYCVAVDNNLLVKSAAKKVMKSFVKVRINPEHGAAEKKIFKSMRGKGYPAFLVKPFESSPKFVRVTPGKKKKSKSKNISVNDFVQKIQRYAPKDGVI